MNENLWSLVENLEYVRGGGANARISDECVNGQNIVRKEYLLPELQIPIQTVGDSYLTYRQCVGETFSIPTLYQMQITGDSSIVVHEEKVKGVSGQQLIGLENDALFIFGKSVFDLLKGKIRMSNDIGNTPYPLDMFIEIKPSNFIIGPGGDLYYVDFFPPRLRQNDGSVYPIDKALSKNNEVMQKFIFGDYCCQYIYFWLNVLRCPVSEVRKKQVMEIFRPLTINVDPDGQMGKLLNSTLGSANLKKWLCGLWPELQKEIETLSELTSGLG
jgi:hypothetical protein